MVSNVEVWIMLAAEFLLISMLGYAITVTNDRLKRLISAIENLITTFTEIVEQKKEQ